MIEFDFKGLFQSVDHNVDDAFSELIRTGYSPHLTECLDYALEHFQGEMMLMQCCELTIDNLDQAAPSSVVKFLNEALKRGVLIDADYLKCLTQSLKQQNYTLATAILNYIEGLIQDQDEVFDHQVEMEDLIALIEELETHELLKRPEVKAWLENHIRESKLFTPFRAEHP